MGASGCGGVFDRFADVLAEGCTVVTYDRRGNGHSPRPPSWATTSAEEQADDAAALLDALGLAPAVVFGTSSGGIFALATVLHHPQAVRGAILHEPALFTLFDDPHEARTTVTKVVADGMQEGGPATAFERFIRLVATDANWERLDPRVRQRMLASAGTYFEMEVGRFDTYLPRTRRWRGSPRQCRSWSAREASRTSLRLPSVSPSAWGSRPRGRLARTSPISITPMSSPRRSDPSSTK